MKHIGVAEPLRARIARLTVAAGAGLLSGYLILLMSALLLQGLAGISLSSPVFKPSLFLVGWAYSALVLFRKSKSVADMIAKGFLLGLSEWLAVSWAVVFFFKNWPMIPVTMLVLCLVGFSITRYLMHWTKEPSGYGEPPPLEDELVLSGDKQSVIVVLKFEDDKLAQSLTCLTEGVHASSGVDRLSA